MSLTDPILVVDDEIEMRFALKKALEKCNYVVDLSHNAKDAIGKLDKNRYSLVITDMTMPKQSGMEILKHIQDKELDSLSIMVSAHGTITTAVEAIKNGAFDFIEKPFNFDTLIFLVERALSQKTPLEKKKSLPKNTKNTDANIQSDVYREIITQDEVLQKTLDIAKNVANTNSTVLIEAESGTGKELLARYLHCHSDRKEMPFVAINCAAFPETLLESELFGHKKGSFTGAIYDHKGKFEQANRGTILLDEISEMALPLQAKLLRVIQERKIVRIGDSEEIKLDFRIIATTNRNLFDSVKKGEFREDLYFRLNVIPITIPPLRERKADIMVLIEHFIQKYGKQNDKLPLTITPETKNILMHYHWRGNVRELENVIERAVILSKNQKIIPENLLMHSTTK